MSNIKKEIEKVYDECTKLYEQGGVSAVIDHVNEQMELNNPLYADVEFMQCTPCNAEQPVLDNICLVCGSVIDGATIDGHLGAEGKAYPEIGQKISTIGEVRELLSDLDDDDLAVLEACDANGDVEDLYPMYIDVIEGIELLNGKTVREVRFCQIPNAPIESLTKSVWVCHDCGSDNVQFKTWTDANGMKATNEECPMEDGDCYCKDCESTSMLVQKTMMPKAKVIGFQVNAYDGLGHEIMHPDMDGSFCIYNLTQAGEIMLNTAGDIDSKLVAIWTDDIEEPTMMFEGDPRD